MNDPSTSSGISVKIRPPLQGTTNKVEVSAVGSIGKILNVSVECLSTPPISGMRKSRRKRKRILLDSTRTAADLPPEIRPLSEYRNSRKRSEKSDSSATHTDSPTKANLPRSPKYCRRQHELQKCVLKSDSDQLRQELKEAQDKILVLEQNLQLKASEMTDVKRREHDLRIRERTLSSELRGATGLLADAEEDRNTIGQCYRNVNRKLEKSKTENAKKDTQIKLLTCRLNELKNLKGNAAMQNRNLQALSADRHELQPSTSSGIASCPPMKKGSIFEDIMSNFKEMLEDQLQCSICNEVYAFATVITCGHTFCEDCIQKWMAKEMSCPECRTQIKNYMPNKVLESYIEKFIESFVPNDFQATRKVLLEERKKKLNRRSPDKLPPTVYDRVREGFGEEVEDEISVYTLTDTENDS